MDYTTPLADITKDYALVIRVLDPTTGQMVVIVGGISAFGTQAASEFLTSRPALAELASAAPDGWERKNIEIVISTDIIRGVSGPAKIAATYFW